MSYDATRAGIDPSHVRRVLRMKTELIWRRRFISRAVNFNGG